MYYMYNMNNFYAYGLFIVESLAVQPILRPNFDHCPAGLVGTAFDEGNIHGRCNGDVPRPRHGGVQIKMFGCGHLGRAT